VNLEGHRTIKSTGQSIRGDVEEFEFDFKHTVDVEQLCDVVFDTRFGGCDVSENVSVDRDGGDAVEPVENDVEAVLRSDV